MKKFIVLGVLFVLPITAYLFFASAKNNFARLPVLTENVKDVSAFDSSTDSVVSFKDKISVVAFFGSDLEDIKGNTFNLDQKILTKYYGFNDFQFVIVLPEAARPEVEEYVEKFKDISDTKKWKIVFGSPEQIKEVFQSFKTPHHLDENSFSPYVFIVDKNANLRGRDEDEDTGRLYGYDSRNIAELSNKMDDDVKVILAEYRLALKKYNRQNKIEKK
ncbi:hypothetical protein C7S20_08620 [Christiangramia fulva]|uniref:Membrane or secreted protein n=1 Tax=Christiangramia fulva TaxID=2126553 RepID=A0A2R3Z4Y6_9FLAO|nr:hypothetical protein [Christiangramia fulva]AVR45325.1 hypothetical protein C7S20_08620 [Christiangramia fulva]